MSRMLLILVVGGYLLYGITNLMLNKNVTEGTQNSADSYSYSQAHNIANSAAQMILSKLADDNTWRVNSPQTISMFGGTATYTVVDAGINDNSSISTNDNNSDNGNNGNDENNNNNGESNDNGNGNNGNHGNGNEGEHGNGHEDSALLPSSGSSNSSNLNKINLAGFTLNAIPSKLAWAEIPSPDDNHGNNGNGNSDNSNGNGNNGNNNNDNNNSNNGNGNNCNNNQGGGNGNSNNNSNNGNGNNNGSDDNNGSNNNNSNSTTSDTTVIKIAVKGTYNDVSKKIIVYAKVPQPGVSVPKFMSYALLTQNSISMNGNVKIQDDNNSSWNANVHTNSDFSMNGNNTIKGFLSYVGNIHSNPSWKLNSDIVPNQNPNNLPVYQQTSTVDIPSFNPDDFKDKATVVYNTNKLLNNVNMTLGTKDHPEIIYVGGDLNISGNISGYGVFIVKGNINLSGNVNIDAEDPNGSNLGFYTSGNINASGNVNIKAQVFASQNVNLSGNVKIYGSLTSRGVCNFSGNVNIYYKPASADLTSPFWQGDSNGQITSNYGFAKKRMQIVRWYE